jgi:RND family efflux transporter MFP subunit
MSDAMPRTITRTTLFTRIAVAAILAASGAACGSPDSDEPQAADAPGLAVGTAAAAIAEIAEPIEAGGTVAAGATAVVTSRVVAPVVEVRVRAGDRVRPGQILVVLDEGALGAQAQQATASVAAAEQALIAAKTEHAAAIADQKLADTWHARVSSLHERRAATSQELDEAEARLSSAAARLGGAQARIDQAGSQVAAARAAAEAASTTHGFAVIRAPFAGLVTERLTDPGNLASPGVPLLRLDAEGVPQVEVRVDEARVGFVSPGDRVEVFFQADGASPVEGVVTEVARAMAADQRAFTVKVSLPKDHAVRTGTFARVRFRGPVRKALFVPADAIRRQGQVATVFVVSDGTARLRLLQTGIVTGGRVEVVAGLDPGEVVVSSPPPSLVDGRHVSTTATRSPEGEER